MYDLKTELGFLDFLGDHQNEIVRRLRARCPDHNLLDCSVVDGMTALHRRFVAGKRWSENGDVLNYWVTSAYRIYLRSYERHINSVFAGTYKPNVENHEMDELDRRQPRKRRTPVIEPHCDGIDITLEKKEDGLSASKQMSALYLFASNNKEDLAVLTAFAEMVRANDTISLSEGSKEPNWSELARQSNFHISSERFTYKTVKTHMRKFSKRANVYLRDSIA